MAESKEELKSLLMKVKEESETVGLRLNIQKTKIMASGPVTSWQIDGETVNLPGSSVHGDSPGKNIGVVCRFLLEGIFLSQGLNPGLPP